MSEWIEHDGKGMPVAADVMVIIKCRDGWESKYAEQADGWTEQGYPDCNQWIHKEGALNDKFDIIAYRIVEATP